MVETVDGLQEKDSVRKLSGELIVSVLWHPEICEAHGETNQHDIWARRQAECVVAVIRRKGG